MWSNIVHVQDALERKNMHAELSNIKSNKDLNKHILITGMYRSGTTLINHLLDGHSDLKVFPVENCIFRDTLVYQRLPFPRQRSMIRLLDLIRQEKVNEAIDYILAHEKLALPLIQDIVLSGSTGDQKISTEFNPELFYNEIKTSITQLSTYPEDEIIKGLFDAYQSAYYTAIGHPSENEGDVFVNKCPEAGLLVDYYLNHLPDSRIIHIVRDPRAVIASFKAKLPKHLYHPFFRILPQINLLKQSLAFGRHHDNKSRVMVVRYEDLVTKPEVIMRKVADFIDIPFEQTLIEPTFLGKPWKSNSSNVDDSDNRYKVYVNLEKYRNKLNKHEIALIESICQLEIMNLDYKLDSEVGRLNKLLNTGLYVARSLFSIGTYIFKLKQKL